MSSLISYIYKGFELPDDVALLTKRRMRKLREKIRLESRLHGSESNDPTNLGCVAETIEELDFGSRANISEFTGIPKKELRPLLQELNLLKPNELRTYATKQYLQKGGRKLEVLCENLSSKPISVHEIILENELQHSRFDYSDLEPYEPDEKLRELMVNGASLKDVAKALGGKSESLARQRITKSAYRAVWEEAAKIRRSVERAEAESQRDNEKGYPNLIKQTGDQLRRAILEIYKKEDPVKHQIWKYVFFERGNQGAKQIPAEQVLGLLTDYAKEKETNPNPNISKLSLKNDIDQSTGHRLIGKAGFFENMSSYHKLTPEQGVVLRKARNEHGASNYDLVEFTGFSLALIQNHTKGIPSKAHLRHSLTYRLASAVYKQADKGTHPNIISLALGRSFEPAIQRALNERAIYEPIIIDVLKLVKSDPTINKPYLEDKV